MSKKAVSILGINHGGHDTSAAFMRDGELIAACEQERHTLDKHSRKFPVDAINDCLLRGRVSIDEVDEINFCIPTGIIEPIFAQH